MKRTILLVLLCSLVFVSEARKKDELKTGSLYAHAVDTVVAQTRANYPEIPIVISADQFILDRIPDSIQGATIVKTKNYKPKNKFEGYIWIRVERFLIHQEDLFVFEKVKIQKGENFEDLPDGLSNYRIKYKCDQEESSYELVEITKGVSSLK